MNKINKETSKKIYAIIIALAVVGAGMSWTIGDTSNFVTFVAIAIVAAVHNYKFNWRDTSNDTEANKRLL